MSSFNEEDDLIMIERIYKAVSAVFHPLILPAIAFTLLVTADSNPDLLRKLIIELVAIVFSVVLLPAYIFLLKYKGVVDSADITIREQRINPLTMGALSYLIGFLLLKLAGASNLIQGLMFCYATNTLLVIASWLKWLQLNAIDGIAEKIAVRTLYIHSDDCVLPDNLRRFYKLVQAPKEMHWFEQGKQTDFYDQAPYVSKAVQLAAAHFRNTLT